MNLENSSNPGESDVEKSNQCRSCSQIFSNTLSRKDHEIHHLEMAYMCPEDCLFMFLDFRKLQSHCERAHNVYLEKFDEVKYRVKSKKPQERKEGVSHRKDSKSSSASVTKETNAQNMNRKPNKRLPERDRSADRWNFKRHVGSQRKHTGLRSNVIWTRCKWYKRAFNSKAQRYNHVMHHNEMMYACPCGYHFENFNVLYNHSLVEHQELLGDDYEKMCRVKTASDNNGCLSETVESPVEDHDVAPLNTDSIDEDGSRGIVSDRQLERNPTGNLPMLKNSGIQHGEVEQERLELRSGDKEVIQGPFYVGGILSVPQCQVVLPTQPMEDVPSDAANCPCAGIDTSNICNRIVRILEKPVSVNEIIKKLAGPISVKDLMEFLEGPVFGKCNMEVGGGKTPDTCSVRIEGEPITMDDIVSDITSEEKKQGNTDETTFTREKNNNTNGTPEKRGEKVKKKTQRWTQIQPCLQASKKRKVKIICPMCARTFANMSQRNEHLEHHDEMRYRCPDFCGFQFEDFVSLRSHYRRTHRAKVPPNLEEKSRMYRKKKTLVAQHKKQRKKPRNRQEVTIGNNAYSCGTTATRSNTPRPGYCSVRVVEGVFSSNATVTVQETSVPREETCSTSPDHISVARRCITGRLHRYRFSFQPVPVTKTNCICGSHVHSGDSSDDNDDITRPVSRPVVEIDLENVQEVNRMATNQSLESQSNNGGNNDMEDFMSDTDNSGLVDETVNNIIQRLSETDDEDTETITAEDERCENKPLILKTSNLSADCRYYNIR